MNATGQQSAEASGSKSTAPVDESGEAVQESFGKDESYFQYYALLSHQAQMLQDAVRTSSYQKAILANTEQCFQDKIVIDVGAGNGILSIFAAQAGARKVYAIEASNMVANLQHFVNASLPSKKPARSAVKNSWVGDRIVPVHSKMEDVTAEMMGGNEKCDTIVSECLGVLLVHERMCESFLDARDRFLKPGGTVLPSAGSICLAPIEDKVVWEEAANKARFWENRNFYGIDVTPFADAAWEEVFSSPVVGCFGPLILLSPSTNYNIDFLTITKENLKKFTIPLSFDVSQTAVIHGLAGWFDLHFLPPHDTDEPFSIDPTVSSTYMTTSPYATPTHWQQVRFLFQEPLAINRGQRVVGEMHCEVNEFRSYTLTATLKIEGSNDALLSRSCYWRLDRQIYSWTSASPSTQ
ncbi:hypothetical protein CBS101457_006332 [Exobasidium rhododendri]|nr:hypothetical protein CBS101457_006332 [Exobasidium rhododendri]